MLNEYEKILCIARLATNQTIVKTATLLHVITMEHLIRCKIFQK